MDHTKKFRGAENRLTGYQERLTRPADHWPADVRRGLNQLNRQLFDTGLSIETLKEKNGTPHKNFSNRFKRYTGMAPRDYRTYHCIEAAKMLLADETLKNLEIGDIGWLAGYEKPHTFSMMFKKRTGLPPGGWRDIQLNSAKIEV